MVNLSLLEITFAHGLLCLVRMCDMPRVLTLTHERAIGDMFVFFISVVYYNVIK